MSTTKEKSEPININDAVDKAKLIESNSFPKEGKITYPQLKAFYPKVLDTVKNRCVFGIEKLPLKLSNGYITTILHNTGAFDQMFLCTHNAKFKLVDSKYIGMATDFDNGKSHTIEYSITKNDEIEFNQVDWGYIGGKIDTVKFDKTKFIVTAKGKLVIKK